MELTKADMAQLKGLIKRGILRRCEQWLKETSQLINEEYDDQENAFASSSPRPVRRISSLMRSCSGLFICNVVLFHPNHHQPSQHRNEYAQQRSSQHILCFCGVLLTEPDN